MRIRILHVLAAYFTVMFSQIAVSNCNTWTLEVENALTKQTKIYKYNVGDDQEIPIPQMKNFKCEFEVFGPKTTELMLKHFSSVVLICGPAKAKNLYNMSASAFCTDGNQGLGSFSIADLGHKGGMPIMYNFTFSSL